MKKYQVLLLFPEMGMSGRTTTNGKPFTPEQLAIRDLEILRDSSPDESNVVFQLAKVYRLVGNEVKSAQLLAVARDTSPKSINKLKKLLDTVKDDDGVAEESREDEMDEG